MAKHPIYYHNKQYPTIASLANELNIKYANLLIFAQRHNYDLSNLIIENGNIRSKEDKRYSKIIINNHVYKSQKEASKKLKLSYSLIRNYIKIYGKNNQKISLDEYCAKKVKDSTINFHGLVFKDIKDMANFYGFSSQTMRRRIRKYGLNDKRVIMHYDFKTKSWYLK